VLVTDGCFTVRLGEGVSSQKIAEVMANLNLWVQLTIDEEAANVLAPRTPLTSAAYSFKGRILSGTTDPTATSPVATIGTYYINVAANPNTTWIRAQTGWVKLN
jgi:hypothetical protein